MRFPQRLQWLAYVLAPGLLVTAVVVQRYNVEVHKQSPWAGGGFGMFSTLDVPGSRITRAYVLTDSGPALIVDPPLESGRLLSTQPTNDRLAAAAADLASRDWYVLDVALPYGGIEPYLPERLWQYLRGLQERSNSQDTMRAYPRMIAFTAEQLPRRARAQLESGRGRGARVEVWRPQFERESNTLSWTMLRSSEAARPLNAKPE